LVARVAFPSDRGEAAPARFLALTGWRRGEMLALKREGGGRNRDCDHGPIVDQKPDDTDNSLNSWLTLSQAGGRKVALLAE
jgi:hypothetical protein